MATNQHELNSLPGIYLLECLLCSKIPTVNRIHQCENGHIVCIDCYSKSTNKNWWEISNNKNCPECQTQMFRTRFPHFVTETILPRLVYNF